jgi:hypothetical protein
VIYGMYIVLWCDTNSSHTTMCGHAKFRGFDLKRGIPCAPTTRRA